jgi:TonB family protein
MPRGDCRSVSGIAVLRPLTSLFYNRFAETRFWLGTFARLKVELAKRVAVLNGDQMSLASMVLLVPLAQRVHIIDPRDVGDGSIASPEVLYYTDPFYTRTARDNKVEGTVTIEDPFDVRGCMKILRTVKGIGFGLDENALAALHSWRFSPAKRNGEPVDAIAQVDIDFSLAAAPPIEYDDVNRPAISGPTVLMRVEPKYTDEARQARVVGTVILQAVVQTNGTANILKVVKPLPLGLTESALEAIQQWKFRPAVSRNGKEIPVAINIEVDFNLEQKNLPNPDVCR